MKAVFVTPVPAPYQLAFAKALHELMEFEFWFLTSIPESTRPKYWEMELPPFCRILKTYFRKSQYYYCPSIPKLLNEYNPDFILLHGKWNNFAWFSSYRWATRHRKKIIMGPLEFPTRQNWFKEALRRSLYRKIDAYLCVGYKSLDYYSKLKGKQRSYHLSYAADIERELLHPLRSVKKEITFLHSGSINDRFRVLDILQAFENVSAIYSNIKLILSGKGPLESICRERIEHSSRLKECVSWIETKSWEEVQDLYLAADVLISNARYAGWGLTIPEAMASGMGVIASENVEAARELILEGYNGFLVRDQISLERAMTSYIIEPEKVWQHGKINKEIAPKEGVYEKAKALFRILEELI